MRDPESFRAKVEYLYRHPTETSRDEIELKNGVMLDRYSAPVVDKNGIYYGRIWSFRDMTEQKRNQEVLQQLSLAVEQSPTSVVITDPKGNINYVNRKFTECTGYSLQEVLGQNPRVLNARHCRPEQYRDLWSTITQGKVWHGEFCNKKKNGEIYWESATITPITNPNGEITHFLAFKEDITEKRTLESQLRHAQKMEGVGQLAAGIAHEINTPTQFVMDNLTFLRDSWKSTHELLEQYRGAVQEMPGSIPDEIAGRLKQAEQSCDLEFIREEVPRAIEQSLDGSRRVAKIVRAMKEFSHPDSAEKTATDLNRAVESTITVARNEWKYVSEVVTKFDDQLPAVVCYPGDINQVVLNLLVNAAHAIKEKVKDEEKGQITVRTRMSGDDVEISVNDNGNGIPEGIRNRVFEPFFTTKEVGKGTGQGLALAYTVVVKKHGGKIWFETEVGKGTTFFITLPAGMAAAAEGGA
jgi:PAS domain S-box-containing protein